MWAQASSTKRTFRAIRASASPWAKGTTSSKRPCRISTGPGKAATACRLSYTSRTRKPGTMKRRAKGRIVGPDGRTASLPRPLFEFVATPGRATLSRRDPQKPDELMADSEFLGNVDPKHYGSGWPRTDAEGRFTMVALIPGALYRIIDASTAQGAQVRRDFTVKPGEMIDLGDILIAKPPK